MAKTLQKYGLVSILMFVTFQKSLCSNVKTCVQETDNPCLCRFDEDVVLDISELAPQKSPLTANGYNSTFYFSGCHDLEPSVCNNTKSSLCLKNVTYDNNKEVTNFISLGDKSQISIVPSDTHLTTYVIKFTKSKTVVSLVCSPELASPKLIASSSIGHDLFVFSPHSCIMLEHHGLSTGSKLLILFLVLVSVYFVAGALILYFIRGARGLEIIPNLDFWRGLPSLVRDGALYVFNGCNPIAVPTADTYDRI